MLALLSCSCTWQVCNCFGTHVNGYTPVLLRCEQVPGNMALLRTRIFLCWPPQRRRWVHAIVDGYDRHTGLHSLCFEGTGQVEEVALAQVSWATAAARPVAGGRTGAHKQQQPPPAAEPAAGGGGRVCGFARATRTMAGAAPTAAAHRTGHVREPLAASAAGANCAPAPAARTHGHTQAGHASSPASGDMRLAAQKARLSSCLSAYASTGAVTLQLQGQDSVAAVLPDTSQQPASSTSWWHPVVLVGALRHKRTHLHLPTSLGAAVLPNVAPGEDVEQQVQVQVLLPCCGATTAVGAAPAAAAAGGGGGARAGTPTAVCTRESTAQQVPGAWAPTQEGLVNLVLDVADGVCYFKHTSLWRHVAAFSDHYLLAAAVVRIRWFCGLAAATTWPTTCHCDFLQR
jgi:hypothetical protein